MKKPDINRMWIVTTVYQDPGSGYKSVDYSMIEASTEDEAKARAEAIRPAWKRDPIQSVTCNHPAKLYEKRLLSFRANIRMDERGVDYGIPKTVIQAASRLPVVCIQLHEAEEGKDLYQLSRWVPDSRYCNSLYVRQYEESKSCNYSWHLDGIPSELKSHSDIETFTSFIPHVDTTISGCLVSTKISRAEQLKEIEQYIHREMIKRVTAYTQSLTQLRANIQQKMEY